MRRILFPLLLIVVILLPRQSWSVRAQNTLVTEAAGVYSLVMLDIKPGCVGSLKLIAPVEKELPVGDLFGQPIKIGRFNEGQELVFELQSDCAPPLYSDNPAHVVVRHEGGVYVVFWQDIDDAGADYFWAMALQAPRDGDKHPVIFIHGLGGHPDDWLPEKDGNKKVYFETLRSAPHNYPDEFLHAYTYSDADGDPDTYDNQGDIRKISLGLKDDVDRLANLYYDGCEKDCVDLVGFSLGGMVIRQYLNDRAAAGEPHKIRKAITIASPHRGVWVLQPFDIIEAIPIRGQAVRKAISAAVSELAKFIGTDINFNSDAVKQITPESEYINNLNNKELSSPLFTTIYGDIDMRLSQKIFHFELTSEQISLGDPIILPKSATGIPASQKEIYEFSDPNILNFRLSPHRDGSIYSFGVDILGLDDLKYEHRKLITNPSVVETVLKEIAQ